MITVEMAATRTIEGFDTDSMLLVDKTYYPFWDGITGDMPTNGYVSISGGFTAMTWQLTGTDGFLTVTKYLNVSGQNISDGDVQNELIAAGWITMADTVTIS